jgi:hypothetical protein
MITQLFDDQQSNINQDTSNDPGLIQESVVKTTQPSVKTLLAWHAPGRPYKKRGKEFFGTSLMIVILLEIITFLFAQYLLMLLIISLTFVVFMLELVPPHNFRYRISTEGITVEDHSYLWQEMYDFYFKKINGIETVHIRTNSLIPGILTLPLGEIDKEHLKTILLSYLPYREVIKPTLMEKSGDWLTKTFPLEKN